MVSSTESDITNYTSDTVDITSDHEQVKNILCSNNDTGPKLIVTHFPDASLPFQMKDISFESHISTLH